VVSLTERDGTHRSFRTSGDTPKVEIHDPLQPHRQLLTKYSDADIHNVTAYLATLR
jgi:cytochrome c oxidase cbb3-type subunit III